MIQRKQTIFLLLALIALIACLCMRLGAWEPKGMGADTVLTNFCLIDGSGTWSFSAIPLAIILLLSVVIAGAAIFCFKNRPLQAKLCTTGILAMVVWTGYAGAYVLTGAPADMTFHLGYGCVLPLVALVLFWLARRGILADEALVRSADRIR